jgi:hypothetical protein
MGQLLLLSGDVEFAIKLSNETAIRYGCPLQQGKKLAHLQEGEEA